jgi:hypothetical protein
MRKISFRVKHLSKKDEQFTLFPAFSYFNEKYDRFKFYYLYDLFIVIKEFNKLRNGRVLITFYGEQGKRLFSTSCFIPFTIYIFDNEDEFKRMVEFELGGIDKKRIVILDEKQFQVLKQFLSLE